MAHPNQPTLAPERRRQRGQAAQSSSELWPARRIMTQTVGLALVIALLDHFIVRPPASGWQELVRHGLGDEVGHLLTAYLWVVAAQVIGFRVMLWPALLGSTLIDLDHIPLVLGLIPAAAGSSRPISHSLFTVGILVACAIRYRHSRQAWLAAAFGLTSHLWRDAGTGAVVFFWPFWREAIRYPYWVFLSGTMLLPLAALAIRRHRKRAKDTDSASYHQAVIPCRSEKSLVPAGYDPAGDSSRHSE